MLFSKELGAIGVIARGVRDQTDKPALEMQRVVRYQVFGFFPKAVFRYYWRAYACYEKSRRLF